MLLPTRLVASASSSRAWSPAASAHSMTVGDGLAGAPRWSVRIASNIAAPWARAQSRISVTLCLTNRMASTAWRHSSLARASPALDEPLEDVAHRAERLQDAGDQLAQHEVALGDDGLEQVGDGGADLDGRLDEAGRDGDR